MALIFAVVTFVLVDGGLAVDVQLRVGVDGDTDVPDVGVDLPGLVPGEGGQQNGQYTHRENCLGLASLF